MLIKLIPVLIYILILPCSVVAQNINSLKTLRGVNAWSENGKVAISAFKAMRFRNVEDSSIFKRIRILRLECPDFVYGTDYNEYFSGLNYEKGRLIFSGSIEPILGQKYTFVDETVEIGSVYAYWMASTNGEPIGPVPVKVRDKEVLWPYEMIINRLERLKNKYPDYVTVEKVGYSVNRKPLLGIKVGKGKRNIALIGAVHAGESGPEIIIPVLEKLLEEKSGLLDKVSVIAIPSVNCDMRDKLAHGNPWYLRRNSNQVDINRNFPVEWDKVDQMYGYYKTDPEGLTYHGPFAGSEPETIAVMGFLKKNKPRAVFSFHCLSSIAGETLLIPKACVDDLDYIDQCYNVAKKVWKGHDSKSLDIQKLVFGTSSGSLADWCYRELGIPGFDVEEPLDSADRAKCAADKTDKELLEKYQDLHFRGFVNLLHNL